MISFIRYLLANVPIRARLTIWYVIVMAITFTLAGSYLMVRFQSNLIKSVDSSLQLAVLQNLSYMEDENQFLAFEKNDYSLAHQFVEPSFTLRLLSDQGIVLDILGEADQVSGWGPTEPGFFIQSISGDDERWRIYTQEIVNQAGTQTGLIQAAQSLTSMTDTQQDFRDELLWMIPLILFLAGLGGFFLAGRMLQPISYITRTAQAIEASDLSLRLDYQGPTDEIGRLAQTFDRMLDRLKLAFERERTFTGDAAHELRTPLTVLKGQIEVTLSRNRSMEDYQDTLQDLAVQVERLIRMSNALLYLSRTDQKQLTWAPVPLNLAELLFVIVEQIQPMVDDKGIGLTADISDDLLLMGDPDHLIRLFLNLLDNAVKFTSTGGQIHVRAIKNPEEYQVKISNTGESISPEHLPHLFERFYRVETSRSRKSGGVGLGLAISQEIARLHGGTIEAFSEPGFGAVFTVRLPVNIP